MGLAQLAQEAKHDTGASCTYPLWKGETSEPRPLLQHTHTSKSPHSLRESLARAFSLFEISQEVQE